MSAPRAGTAPPRAGSIVAFWSGGTLAFAAVLGEDKGRLRLLLPRGREERVTPARIALEVHPAGGGARLAEAEEEVRRLAAAADVRSLWQIVVEARSEAEPEPISTLAELAELACGSSGGVEQAALLLALQQDGLHFVRRPTGHAARTPEAVEEIALERERAARREEETRRLFAALAAAARGAGFSASGGEVERRHLDALLELALHNLGAGEGARALALAALQASGLAYARPHEGAFRLLRAVGRLASDDENLQVLRFGLRTAFPADVLEHAAAAARRGFPREGRRDLRELCAISIDSPNTREIDDLLSVERQGAGFRLGVHIADPAAFVDADDAVDREAASRGLTHYLPDLRLPMLPPAISEGAASLIAGQERPALSFLVDLSEEGEIARYEVVPSIVRAAARLDYAGADGDLESGGGVLGEALGLLAAAGRARLQARLRAGAIVITAPEVDVHVAADGTLTLERLPAESASRLAVSEAMILAGEVAARFCLDAGIPAIYRRQSPAGQPPELPPREAFDPVLVRRARRVMKRAETGLEPGLHAGLGLSAYAQVSSPLRRYQDLALHRQIAAHLAGRPPCYDAEALARIAATTEQAEGDARRAEQAADEYWTLRYLEGQVGQDLEAWVVELDPRPVVQLVLTLNEQPMNGLAGAVLGARIRVRVQAVNPRAGLLSLRRVE